MKFIFGSYYCGHFYNLIPKTNVWVIQDTLGSWLQLFPIKKGVSTHDFVDHTSLSLLVLHNAFLLIKAFAKHHLPMQLLKIY